MLTRRQLIRALGLALAASGIPAARALVPAQAGAVAASAEKTTFSMGTVVSFKVCGPTQEQASVWLEAADAEMGRLASLLTVHAEKSPLLDVMRRSGEAVAVPPEVAECLKAALVVARDSGRAFEPTIGKLVDVWKIGFGGESVPADAAIREALRYVDYRRVKVWRKGGQDYVRIGRGQDVDLGGIAKGYIGTKLAAELKVLGAKSALMSLGGNVVLVGSSPSGAPWRIGLQHPDEERNGYFAVLEAEDESVITSGAYERKIEVKGKSYGHILSPVTGRPVATDLSSVSIASKDGALADAWCTALFAMGQEKARRLLASRRDLEAVLMSRDCRSVWMTPGIAARCEVTDPSVKNVHTIRR